jgi:large subunit ribosomal protein L2
LLFKKFKPITNGVRNKKLLILKNRLKFKPLTIRLKNKGGRNNTGKITIRHKGNGIKKNYRIIDFFSYKYNLEFKCNGFEKSKYNSACLALMFNKLNIYKYIIAPNNFEEGNLIKITFNFINDEVCLGWVIPLG